MIVVPRKLVVYLVAVACSFAATPPACVGSLPVGSFRLVVQPEKGGGARPLRLLNNLKAGEKLRYEPFRIPDAVKQKAQVALVLVPPSQNLIVLDPHAAAKPAEWKIPQDAGVVALVFGPHGLNVKKVKSLVGRNEEILTQLADYAEQTEKIETLVATVEKSETSGANLNAALAGFSAQYGLALPKIDSKAPSDQQAALLLRAMMPSVAAYDPLNPRSTVQQSTGLAASLAAMFFGTPVGLVAGGASLFQNLRVAMFPDTEFRSAIAHPADADAMALCAKPQAAKPHTRIAYLWAHRVPGLDAPAAGIAAGQHLPLTLNSTVKGTNFLHLDRAHDWRLAAVSSKDSFPVKVTSAPDALTLDLAQIKVPPGEYRLTAQWDWEPMVLGGTLQLHALDDLASARLSQPSRDRLVEAGGHVPVELTGADFQFVEKVAIEKEGKRRGQPQTLEFTLPTGKRMGEQRTLETEIDAGTLRQGSYRLLLTQADQKTRAVPVTIHAPVPKFDNLPVRVNLGEAEQPLSLRGAPLDRIERIDTPAGEVTMSGGSASIKLREEVRAGEEFPMELKLRGIDQPVTLAKAILVAGRRPRITGVRKSPPGEAAVALRAGEVPAGSPVSFELSVENMDPSAAVDLNCADKTERVQARTAGAGVLFFAVDPGSIGHSGCQLEATVTLAATGTSKPARLGRVVRLPRIAQFHLTDEKLGDSIYAGSIEGMDLETIAKTGWDDQNGLPVEGLPTSAGAGEQRQTLKIALPWPAPAPHAPLFIWLRGESQGRPTGVKY
jgi:hypothetical protein